MAKPKSLGYRNKKSNKWNILLNNNGENTRIRFSTVADLFNDCFTNVVVSEDFVYKELCYLS